MRQIGAEEASIIDGLHQGERHTARRLQLLAYGADVRRQADCGRDGVVWHSIMHKFPFAWGKPLIASASEDIHYVVLEYPLSLTSKRAAETHYITCMTPGKARAIWFSYMQRLILYLFWGRGHLGARGED